MGFFDDFGKKISTAGQSAITKTKEFADVARLNSNISDEENRIKNVYSEIGKMYFEIHQNDFEECFESQFMAIKESQAKIKEYEEQVIEIKGVTKCANCGAEVPRTALFCASCGSAVVRETKEEEHEEEHKEENTEE